MENNININKTIDYLKELRDEEVKAAEEAKEIKRSCKSAAEITEAENKAQETHRKASDALFMVMLYAYTLPPEERALLLNAILKGI